MRFTIFLILGSYLGPRVPTVCTQIISDSVPVLVGLNKAVPDSARYRKKNCVLSRRIMVLYIVSKKALRDLCSDLDVRLVPGWSHRDSEAGRSQVVLQGRTEEPRFSQKDGILSACSASICV